MRDYFWLFLMVSSVAVAEAETTRIEEPIARRVDLGVQAGFTISGANVSQSAVVDPLTGFTVGVNTEARLYEDWFYVQPELNFTQRGATTNALGPTATARLNYLELPVLAKFRFNLGTVAPYILVGPRLAYLVATSNVDRNRFRSVDFGLDLGGGTQFNLNPDLDLYVTAKYTFGLTDLDATAASWRNQGLQVLAGLMF